MCTLLKLHLTLCSLLVSLSQAIPRNFGIVLIFRSIRKVSIAALLLVLTQKLPALKSFMVLMRTLQALPPPQLLPPIQSGPQALLPPLVWKLGVIVATMETAAAITAQTVHLTPENASDLIQVVLFRIKQGHSRKVHKVFFVRPLWGMKVALRL